MMCSYMLNKCNVLIYNNNIEININSNIYRTYVYGIAGNDHSSAASSRERESVEEIDRGGRRLCCWVV